MCGRYTLKTDRSKIEERFGLEDVPAFEPRYNLGPTQDGLIVRPSDAPGTRTAAMARWGLIPSWAKDPGSIPLLFNARSETAASKPAFRSAFRQRRCLVVADGFYEWSTQAGRKMPHHFTVEHGEPFAMAGLWESWHPPGATENERRDTFTILTTSANDLLAPYHDRMPVILPPEFYDDWMNPLVADRDTLQRFLVPFSALHMGANAVSPRVNSIKHDDPACLAPPEDPDAPPDPGQPQSGQLGLDLY